jgi:hypothetical protein
MKGPEELWTVARCFGDMVDEVVFVGGMIRELLITDPAAGPARPTRDVDCIVNAVSWAEYMRLSDRLRARGFAECTDEDAPICRWVVEGIRVDVMPIDPAVFGFSNVWYASGIANAIRTRGPQGSVRIVDAVHFCATKIEAFLARGESDFFQHDMEDFIAVVDARPELAEEIARAPADVREFIAETVRAWLTDTKFIDALAGHLAGDPANQARQPVLLARLRAIAAHVRSEKGAIQGARLMPAMTTRREASFERRELVPAVRTAPSRVTLQSSHLESAAYDPGAKVLTIKFRNSRIYAYSDVPANVYAGLLGAASHGRYFNQWIKDRYASRRL